MCGNANYPSLPSDIHYYRYNSNLCMCLLRYSSTTVMFVFMFLDSASVRKIIEFGFTGGTIDQKCSAVVSRKRHPVRLCLVVLVSNQMGSKKSKRKISCEHPVGKHR